MSLEQPSIVCPACGLRSYHPMDIQERYCGYCHAYHPNLEGRPMTDRDYDVDAGWERLNRWIEDRERRKSMLSVVHDEEN